MCDGFENFNWVGVGSSEIAVARAMVAWALGVRDLLVIEHFTDLEGYGILSLDK